MTRLAASEEAQGPLAFLYSGHGGQAFHMGRAIYEGHAGFRAEAERLDELYIRHAGVSILEQLFDPGRRKAEPLDDIRVSHPAIFLMELALTNVLVARFGKPDFLLGASLGEFVAAVVAGSISPQMAMARIAQDAEALHRAAQRGGMLAILGDVGLYERHAEIAAHSTIATLVDDTHFVVSGTLAGLARVQQFLADSQIDFIRLPVRFAFHSGDTAGLCEGATSLVLRDPAIPIISCSACAVVRRYAPNHMSSAVQGRLNIGAALDVLQTFGPMTCVDLGPGSGLAAALKRRWLPHWLVLGVLTSLGKELNNFQRVEAALAARANAAAPVCVP